MVNRAGIVGTIALIAAAATAACGSGRSAPTPVPSALKQGTVAVFHPPPGSESWLRDRVLLTIYGRGFGIAPILGRLGYDTSFADMHAQVQPYKRGIKTNDDGRHVTVAVHLIYGLAMPCSDAAKCLLYLDDTGVNIVKQYILPAERLHWLVFLDTQLGTTSPSGAVERMIKKGYLKYDNVEVAIDPEFHLSQPYDPTLVPGLAFGSVTAYGINKAQRILSAYVSREGLPHKKILLVHEFLPSMIAKRWRIKTDVPNAQVVINADGLGPPVAKALKYRELVGSQVKHGVRYRGIKLFLANPAVDAQHTDIPAMQWPQVFGHWPELYNGHKIWVHPAPNVVIIA